MRLYPMDHEIVKMVSLLPTKQCRVLAILCPLILSSWILPFTCADAEIASSLRIGYSGSVYQDATNADIRASISILIQKVALKQFTKAESHYYETLSEIAAALQNRKIEALALPPDEFMELRKMIPIEPILVTASDRGIETELLLLVRKDSGIRSFRDLRGRTIMMPTKNPRCLSMHLAWIETLLFQEGGKSTDSYFLSVKESRTEAKAIVPVFFRQVDACITTRQVFELSAELNPQIGRELMVISSKEKLAQGIISVDKRLPEEFKSRIKSAFLTLHQTAEGKQLLMLFKMSRMEPFVPDYLKATEALYAEHSRLSARRRF